MLKRVVSVSIPRSGHHLLVSLLWHYFPYRHFFHCESYTDPECCRQIPCNRAESRARSSFGSSAHLRLFMQKTHDRTLEVPKLAAEQYLVQYRDPVQAAIALIRWEMTYGGRDNYGFGEIPGRMFEYALYFVRFYHKWCLGMGTRDAAPRIHHLRYEQLSGPPDFARKSLQDFLQWLNLPIFDDRIDYALEKALFTDAHTGAKREPEARVYAIDYYDAMSAGMLRFLAARVRAFCPGLEMSQGTLAQDCMPSPETIDRFNPLFNLADLAAHPTASLDFCSESRSLDAHSLRAISGYPVLGKALGLSYGKRGTGVWILNGIAVFPFRSTGGTWLLRGQFMVRIPKARSWTDSLLSLTLAVDGRQFPVTLDVEFAEPAFRVEFSARCSAADPGADTGNAVLVLTTGSLEGLAGQVQASPEVCIDSLDLAIEGMPSGRS